jgi:hypothetical protein
MDQEQDLQSMKMHSNVPLSKLSNANFPQTRMLTGQDGCLQRRSAGARQREMCETATYEAGTSKQDRVIGSNCRSY